MGFLKGQSPPKKGEKLNEVSNETAEEHAQKLVGTEEYVLKDDITTENQTPSVNLHVDQDDGYIDLDKANINLLYDNKSKQEPIQEKKVDIKPMIPIIYKDISVRVTTEYLFDDTGIVFHKEVQETKINAKLQIK